VRGEKEGAGGFRTWVTLLCFEVTGLGWFSQCGEMAKAPAFTVPPKPLAYGEGEEELDPEEIAENS
jgi:hypothetical protein